MHKLIAAGALTVALPIAAATDELGDLKSQLEATRRMVQELEKRVQALERRQASPAAAAPAAASAPPGGEAIAPNEMPATAAADAAGARLEIYGFVQADFIYDFKRVDPSYSATLRPSTIPVACPGDPGCGHNGETIFSVRQTRLGLNGFLPTSAGELKTVLEFDLFGVAGDAGQTTFHLLQAYGEIGPFLAGQTYSLFMDKDVFPNIIDYWGPGGMLYLQSLQARWTPWAREGMKFAVALESPGASVDAGNAPRPDGWQAHNRYPDLTAQLRIDRRWGHLQVAGVLRYLGYENPTLPGISNPSGHVTGYGLNLTASRNLGAQDKLMGQLAFGRGIAAYFNDCCEDVAPNGALDDAEAVPAVGWLVYYDHYWNERFSSSIGWSGQYQDNSGGQSATAFHQGQYGSANLLYHPVKNVITGAELLYGKRENKDGASGEDTRVQFSAKYTF